LEYLDLADSALHAPAADGKKRVAYLAMLEFLARNEIEWAPPGTEETVAMIEGVAAGGISESELADWLRATRP
jgi:prophage maintenance system killer protein